jgi:hypothetical protein
MPKLLHARPPKDPDEERQVRKLAASRHAMSTRPAELVLLPLRMAAWARGQQGHPVVRGALVDHPLNPSRTPRSDSPSTSSSKASPPRSAASVTPTTTP